MCSPSAMGGAVPTTKERVEVLLTETEEQELQALLEMLWALRRGHPLKVSRRVKLPELFKTVIQGWSEDVRARLRDEGIQLEQGK